MIKTRRIFIRPPSSLLDTEPFAQMNADPLVRRYFPSLLSSDESERGLVQLIDHQNTHGFTYFTLEIEGEFAGYCGLLYTKENMPFPISVEIGWCLKSQYWNQGYAFEAATACLNHGILTLGFSKILSFTASINEPSWRLMERLNMKRLHDFDHPKLPINHSLARHRLYEIGA